MKYTIDKRVLLIRTIGNFLVLGALVAIFYTFWPIISAAGGNFYDKISGKKYEATPVVSSTQSFGSLLGKAPDPNLKILTPKDPNFSIIVEKIGADAPIIPNVDTTSKTLYDAALKRGVAHALGTAFPGQPGVTYLFAHSTDTIFNVPRYNAIFYLLKDMAPGDPIVIFFNNRRYDYVATETKITEPNDVYYLTLKTQEQILVMQTCYPPGTTWKRLLVVAKPVGKIGSQ